MLVWLKIIKERYPEYGNSIDNVVLGWDFSHVIDPCGTLYGAYLENGQPNMFRKVDWAMKSTARRVSSCGVLIPVKPVARSLMSWPKFTAYSFPMIHATRVTHLNITML